MSLGLARDSVGDLLRLAADGDPSLRRRVSQGDVGDESEVPVKGVRKESIGDDGGVEVFEALYGARSGAGAGTSPVGARSDKSVTSSSASASASVPPSTAAESYDVNFGEEIYEPLHEFATRRGKKLWCCLLPPWCGGDGDGGGGEKGAGAAIDIEHSAFYAHINSPQHLPVAPSGPSLSRHSSSGSRAGILRDSGLRGSIMRRGGKKAAAVVPDGDRATTANSNGSGAALRRSFLPDNYREKNPERLLVPKKVHFSPYARRVNVRWAKDMSDWEKSHLWWQLDDFEQFKMCNCTITKSMKLKNNGSGSFDSDIPNVRSSGGGGDFDDENDEKTAKWWHRYGHSRRGLEQFVSGEEARQRQAIVRRAHLAVFEEQDRQRMLHGAASPDKIARVAREYSAWAKDLAYAAAMSDADAVKSGFRESRKSREFYLLKHTLGSQCAVPAHTPQFMMPPGVPTRILDSNTSSSILYRKRVQMQEAEERARRRQQRREKEQHRGESSMGRREGGVWQGQGEPTAAVRRSISPAGRGRGEDHTDSMVAEDLIRKVQDAALGCPPAEASALDSAAGGGKAKATEAAERSAPKNDAEEKDEEGQLEELNDSASALRASADLSKKAAGFGGGGADKVDIGKVMTSYASSNLPE